MIAKSIAIAAVGTVLAGAMTGRADITQTADFSTNLLFSGTGSTSLPLGYFSASFSPYAGNPADLTGFEIAWSVTLSASAVVSPGVTGGFGGGPGGSYLVDNFSAYGGNGGSLTGSTSTPGGTIPLATTTLTNTTVFLAANAGSTYDPKILADMLSTNSVDLSWDTGFTLGYYSILSGQLAEDGSVTLTYNTVPEPGTMALAGLGASACFWLRRRKA